MIKVVSDYVGIDETALSNLKELLERHRDVERLLKAIKNELYLMNKAMEAVR